MRILFGAALIAVAIGQSADAKACSCIRDGYALVHPNLVAAPLNYRVRVQMPRNAKTTKPILRAYRGAAVPVNGRLWNDESYTYVELVPTQLLQATTLYEVVVDTDVIGHFTTGTDADKTAPTIDAVGTVSAGSDPTAFIPACESKGPWVDIGPIKATDPGRPNAKFLYAVWARHGTEQLDPARPPDRLLPLEGEMLVLGKRRWCERHDFPFPDTMTMTFAIAAVDEAGNMSALKVLSVKLL